MDSSEEEMKLEKSTRFHIPHIQHGENIDFNAILMYIAK
jgi:hypothetical protein